MATQASTEEVDFPSLPGSHGITITTPRLILRNYTISDTDVDFIFRLRSDLEVLKYVHNHPCQSHEEAREWIISRQGQTNSFNFVAVLRDEPTKAIASIGGIRTPEFGYMIDRQYWGKGLATEAMRAAIDTYWRVHPDGLPGLPLEKRGYVECWILKKNLGSLGVVRKLGFSYLRDDIEPDDGGIGEIWRVGKEEWMKGMEGRERVEVKRADGSLVP